MNQLTVDCSMGVVRELFQSPIAVRSTWSGAKVALRLQSKLQNRMNKNNELNIIIFNPQPHSPPNFTSMFLLKNTFSILISRCAIPGMDV